MSFLRALPAVSPEQDFRGLGPWWERIHSVVSLATDLWWIPKHPCPLVAGIKLSAGSLRFQAGGLHPECDASAAAGLGMGVSEPL